MLQMSTSRSRASNDSRDSYHKHFRVETEPLVITLNQGLVQYEALGTLTNLLHVSYISTTHMTSLPNIPVEPRNGMIRTYNHDRTFTRPYSAKTVFFYKEGDEYFTDCNLK
ncbi:hypothetical protein OSTOST_07254 [Ostertagia ostertagi]